MKKYLIAWGVVLLGTFVYYLHILRNNSNWAILGMGITIGSFVYMGYLGDKEDLGTMGLKSG